MNHLPVSGSLRGTWTAMSQPPCGGSGPRLEGGCRRTLGSPFSPERPGSRALYPGPGLAPYPSLPQELRGDEGLECGFLPLPAGLQEIEKFSFNEELCQEVWTTVISGRPWSTADGSEEAGLFWGTLWGPAEARVASPSAPSTSSKPPGLREESRRDEGGEPRGSHGATKS